MVSQPPRKGARRAWGPLPRCRLMPRTAGTSRLGPAAPCLAGPAPSDPAVHGAARSQNQAWQRQRQQQRGAAGRCNSSNR